MNDLLIILNAPNLLYVLIPLLLMWIVFYFLVSQIKWSLRKFDGIVAHYRRNNSVIADKNKQDL